MLINLIQLTLLRFLRSAVHASQDIYAYCLILILDRMYQYRNRRMYRYRNRIYHYKIEMYTQQLSKFNYHYHLR